MPSLSSGDLIRELRIRKGWQQKRLLEKSGIEAAFTLSRIENRHQKPKIETFRSIMEDLAMPVDQLFCPYLVNQTMDVYILRDQLINYLDNGEDDPAARQEAKSVIVQLENTDGFHTGINLQFLLSCKARLYEMEGENPTVIYKLIKEGMTITYPEFDEKKFKGEVLILEEIELLHTLALTYGSAGDLNASSLY